MAITQVIPSLGTVPTTTDPANFDANADLLLGSALPAFRDAVNVFTGQANTLGTQATADAASALNSAATAVAYASFAGAWSGLTGALSVPASVSNAGSLWVLLVDLPDVTASEPASSNASWFQINVIPSQSGNANFVLSTDGANLQWLDSPIIPAQAGNSGSSLTTDGTSISWTAQTPAGRGSFTCSGNPAAGALASINGSTATQVSGAGVVASVGAEAVYEAVSITSTLGRYASCYDPAQKKTYKLYVDPTDGFFYVIAGTTTGTVTSWDTTNRLQIFAGVVFAAAIIFDDLNKDLTVVFTASTGVLNGVRLAVAGDVISFAFPVTTLQSADYSELAIAYLGTNTLGRSSILVSGINSVTGFCEVLSVTPYSNGLLNVAFLNGASSMAQFDMCAIKVGADNTGVLLLASQQTGGTAKVTLFQMSNDTTLVAGAFTELDGGACSIIRATFNKLNDNAYVFWVSASGESLYTVISDKKRGTSIEPSINFIEIVPSMIAYDASAVAVDSNTGLLNFAHNIGGGQGLIKTYEMLGNALTLKAAQVFNVGNTSAMNLSAGDAEGVPLLTFTDEGDSFKGKSVSITPPRGKTNAFDFGGIYVEAGTDGASVSVQQSGLAGNQINLINGQNYWVSNTGALETYPTGVAYVGVGRSATTIELGLSEPVATLSGKYKANTSVTAGDPVALVNGAIERINMNGESSSVQTGEGSTNLNFINTGNGESLRGQTIICAIDTDRNILVVFAVYGNNNNQAGDNKAALFSFDISNPDSPVAKDYFLIADNFQSSVVQYTARHGDMKYSTQLGTFMVTFVQAAANAMQFMTFKTNAEGFFSTSALQPLPFTASNSLTNVGYDPVKSRWFCTGINNPAVTNILLAIGPANPEGLSSMPMLITNATGLPTSNAGNSNLNNVFNASLAYVERDNTWVLFAAASQAVKMLAFKIPATGAAITYGPLVTPHVQSTNKVGYNTALWDPVAERVILVGQQSSTFNYLLAGSYSISGTTLTETSPFTAGETRGSGGSYVFAYYSAGAERTVVKLSTDKRILIDSLDIAGSLRAQTAFRDNAQASLQYPIGSNSGVFFTDSRSYIIASEAYHRPINVRVSKYGGATTNIGKFAGVAMQSQQIGGETSIAFRGLVSGLSGLVPGSHYAPTRSGELEITGVTTDAKAISATELIL